jgi:hypothetical protein
MAHALIANAHALHANLACEPAMDRRTRVLVHQIHPLKLATDWGSAAVAAWLLWQHRLWVALSVGLAPPVVASAALLAWADLESYHRSRFGGYVEQHMPPAMEGVRLLGLALVWVGAWAHRTWLFPVGVLTVFAGWSHGLWQRAPRGPSAR